MPLELYLFSLLFSILAIIVSFTTAWLTFFNMGKLLITRPAVIFFGPDGSVSKQPKVYFRALLYSSSKRGQVVESLHVSLIRNETKQNFSIWVYGENDNLKRGSGIYVPQEGVTYNHHFLLPADGTNFEFIAGKYHLVIYAKLVNNSELTKLASVELEITEFQAAELTKSNGGIYFDWGADQQAYLASTNRKNSKDS